MKNTFDWLRNENNRGALLVVTGFVASVVSAIWIIYIYFNPHSEPNIQLEKNILICYGSPEFHKRCPSDSIFIGCGNPDAAAAKACADLNAALKKEIVAQPGGMCGFVLREYQCQVNSR